MKKQPVFRYLHVFEGKKTFIVACPGEVNE